MEQNEQKEHVTKKTKKIVMLPAIKSYVYQPNRVTNAIYDYSLIQERVFNSVMYYLQDAIKISLKGKDYQQLSLWKDTENKESIHITIPLSEITSPQNYEYVKDSISTLVSTVLRIPYIDEKTKEPREKRFNLLNADIPVSGERTSLIKIFIHKDVARLLIEIDQNNYNQPINYTRFVYEIAQHASNKYTSRIYKLLCSWKKKGGFVMSMDEFRKWLGIEDKYKEFKYIKKRILLPVQEELFEKADCWFNCKATDFTVKNGNTVTHLNFKIITPEFLEDENKKKDYIFNLLRTHFKFNDTHIDKIQPIFNNAGTSEIINKITQLKEYYIENITKIADITNYVEKSLLNEFGADKLF